MIHKHFHFHILVRVAVIVALALLLAFVIAWKQMLFGPVVVVLALAAAVTDLIRYISKSNKDLTHFLLSIRQGAFTESYTSGNRGKPYEALSDALNEVVREFASLNLEKELHYQYLQALNENLGVAILSFDTADKLLMMNPAARKLLEMPAFSKLEDFKRIDPALYDVVLRIHPEQRVVVQTFLHLEQIPLNVQAKEIVLRGERVRIILLQNLRHELEEKEIEAWHQLMRVLTHEIMNSVTPIISLTRAIQTILSHPDGTRKDLRSLPEENIEDVHSSLSILASRSNGLLQFVKSYKDYSRPLALHTEPVELVALVRRIGELLAPDLQQLSVSLTIDHAGPAVPAKVDVALMEQVLINLIKNAMEAVPHDGSGMIDMGLECDGGGTYRITIADNGPGMDQETMSRIFIPFFTTKPRGTGIGLSLSRQIMRLHNGTIRVHSTVGKGSVFTLEWS